MNGVAFAAFADDMNPDTDVPVSSLNNPTPPWLPGIRRRMQELLSLERGWDSYDACRIDPENVRAAIELLQMVMEDDVRPPEVVPTINGGVQMEWSEGDGFLEVEVLNRTQFLCLDSAMNEFEVRFDVSPLKQRLVPFKVSDF